jgi:hypothetical protein
MMSDALELAGLGCLIAAAFLVSIALGLAALGVSLLVVAFAFVGKA